MRYFAALLFTLILPLLAGCGGGSSSGGAGRTTAASRAAITVLWPENASVSAASADRSSTRVVPAAANSIQIDIKDGTTSLGSQIVARPAAGGPVTVSFDSLPVGNFTVAATAFPQADGTGTPLAAASAPLALQAGQTTTFSLTLASTIDHLELNASASQVVSGGTIAISVTAKDAAGAVILLTPGKLVWTSSQPTVAAVDAQGTVTSAQMGTTSISVTDTESTKTAAININVLLGISVQPATATVTLGSAVTLTATLVGTTNTAVTWSVQEAGGGTVTFGGVYTAPNQRGTFHVTATSVADNSRTSTATIIVKAGSATATIQ